METKEINQKDEAIQKLTEKYIKAPIKADIFSLEQMKITLDDFLIEYATACGLTQKHTLTDFQNTIGIISTIQAAIVVFLGYFYKFDDTKKILAIILAIYFGINIFSFIISYFFGGKISFKEFEAVTKIDKTPVYVIILHWKGKGVPVKYHKSVLDLFDEAGRLDHIEFLKDLKTLFNE